MDEDRFPASLRKVATMNATIMGCGCAVWRYMVHHSGHGTSKKPDPARCFVLIIAMFIGGH